MQLDKIHTLLAHELDKVDGLIASQLGSDVTLIRELGQHIFGSGGKRIRPSLVLLSSLAFGYQGNQHIKLAAIVELIHTATLLHDDVVDASSLRRGKTTANKLWGNGASVLVGDFLYSCSFQMMVDISNLPILSLLANAANTMAKGEIMQLVNCNDSAATEAHYMEIIRYKTATLFTAAAQLGAMITARSDHEIEHMAAFGTHLGVAFQLIDDALDYGASSTDIGKNMGDDLAEGKPTLPLIYAMHHGNAAQAQLIQNALKHNDLTQLEPIRQTLEETKAIQHTYFAAREQAELALSHLDILPASDYSKALQELAYFVLEREF